MAGIRSQNEPAEFDGQRGFWVQGDCVFIPEQDLQKCACGKVHIGAAIQEYRMRMERGKIGISHNRFCGSLLGATSSDETPEKKEECS